MQISEILDGKGDDIVTAKPGDSMASVIDTLAKYRIGALLVAEDGYIKGIVSERDIVGALAEHGASIVDKPVDDFMTVEVKTCSIHDRVSSVLGMMTGGRFRHAPVVKDSRLVGIISIGDIVKARLDEQAREADALRDYIQMA